MSNTSSTMILTCPLLCPWRGAGCTSPRQETSPSPERPSRLGITATPAPQVPGSPEAEPSWLEFRPSATLRKSSELPTPQEPEDRTISTASDGVMCGHQMHLLAPSIMLQSKKGARKKDCDNDHTGHPHQQIPFRQFHGGPPKSTFSHFLSSSIQQR
jgi:hypothetical protein